MDLEDYLTDPMLSQNGEKLFLVSIEMPNVSGKSFSAIETVAVKEEFV